MNYYFEGAAILAPFSITSNEPMFDVDTISLKKQRATQNAQRWELSFNVINDSNPADLFVNTMINFDQVSTMIMPQFKAVYDATTASGNPTVAITGNSNASSVVLDSVAVEGIIPKGSFVRFSNHDKIYLVTAKVDLYGTEDKAVSLYPNLKASVTVGTSMLLLKDCLFSYYRDISNVQGITFSDGVLSGLGTINLIEAL